MKVTTSASGEFTISKLPIGTYTLTINAPGFSPLTLNGVEIEAGKATGLGVEKLQTGVATETVDSIDRAKPS